MINIQKKVKLSEYSTFKIGGEAKEFVVVSNDKELLEAINYAKINNSKFFILGGGSNVLFNDKGFDGIVIKLQDTSCKIQENFIECGAGLPLADLVSNARDNGLSGLEWAMGIPGTIGGAVRGNVGAFRGAIADVIAEVRVYDATGSKTVNYEPEKCDFGYRESIFKKNPNLIILSAKIKLEKGSREEIEVKMKEISKKRSDKQPTGWIGSAGSFFMNPVVEDENLRKRFEEEIGTKSVGNRIPAGWLIEEAGLKGKKFGNISISDVNANFLINDGEGTMEEVVMVASIIKQKVRNKFGVELQEEVKIVYNR